VDRPELHLLLRVHSLRHEKKTNCGAFNKKSKEDEKKTKEKNGKGNVDVFSCTFVAKSNASVKTQKKNNPTNQQTDT